jgi:hypothetical protein
MKRHLLAALSLAACGDPSATSGQLLPMAQAPVTPPVSWRIELPIGDVTGAVPLDLPDGPALLTSLHDEDLATHQILRLDSGGQLVPERVDLTARTCGMDRGDVDGDGVDEIVLATEDGIELRDPSTLAVIAQYPAAGAVPLDYFCGVHARDLDGDGIDEIVLTNDHQGELDVYAGDGTLLDSFDGSYDGYESATQLVFAELDATPGLEMVVNDRGDLVDGDLLSIGTLASVFAVAEGTPCAAADIDGDGIDEVLLHDYGTLTLVEPFANDVIWTAHLFPDAWERITVADLDGDGLPEFIFRGSDDTDDTLMAVDGVTGTVTTVGAIGPSAEPRSTLRWDADGDGLDEWALIQESHVTLLRADGTELIRTPALHGGKYRTFADDFDGDGQFDVVLLADRIRGDTLVVDGASGTIRSSTRPTWTTPADATAATTGDLDGDGQAELFVHHPAGAHAHNDPDLFVYTLGTTGFTVVHETRLPNYANQMIAVDTDGDGVDEIWMHDGREEACLFDLFAGTRWCLPFRSVDAIEIGDLNGDGTPELLAMSEGRGLAVLRASDGAVLTRLRGPLEDMVWHAPARTLLVTRNDSTTLGRYTVGVGGLVASAPVPLPDPGLRELFSEGGLVWFGKFAYNPVAGQQILGFDPSNGELVELPAFLQEIDDRVAAAGNAVIHADAWTITRYNR